MTYTASSLTVHIKDRDGTFFQGEAHALSSWDEKGVFDILPEHENFICLVHKFITIHLPNQSLKTLQIERGVLKVQENTVEIYLGTLPYQD